METRPAQASPIRTSHERYEAALADKTAARSWSTYLLAGPSVWSSTIHPRVTPEVRTAIWHALGSERPETNAWVQFLLWKQSLDSARFAHFHPHVAPILNRISTSNLATQVAQNPTTTPSSTTPLTQPQTLTPPTVPEPAPIVLAALMTGWGLWWRRRQR
jgi:hypothetical protein